MKFIDKNDMVFGLVKTDRCIMWLSVLLFISVLVPMIEFTKRFTERKLVKPAERSMIERKIRDEMQAEICANKTKLEQKEIEMKKNYMRRMEEINIYTKGFEEGFEEGFLQRHEKGDNR
jgi:flagellar biosynthesis/type III secretory pathway protein FliH